ncbi:HAD-IA family hydrolase [Streptomyces sp. NEAU-H3]|uniref:HAD-IA family hydrolase n=1 Tax=Streptomyces sp. NEAU-H3 TaxID=2720636 RepID=UPI00280BEF1D|nr:HAD-IA family hydrolase [Streptomyces sp. NEAU-H3]
MLGCRKPGPRMYRYANDGLDLDPAHCLFVDDAPALVTAATALGDAGSSWIARESRETCGRSPPSATSCPSPDGLTLPRGKVDLDGRRDSRGAEGVDQDLGEPRRAFRRPLRYHAVQRHGRPLAREAGSSGCTGSRRTRPAPAARVTRTRPSARRADASQSRSAWRLPPPRTVADTRTAASGSARANRSAAARRSNPPSGAGPRGA